MAALSGTGRHSVDVHDIQAIVLPQPQAGCGLLCLYLHRLSGYALSIMSDRYYKQDVDNWHGHGLDR
ncbi:hypothetical protein RRG08_028340 [Elysia crispata]|uniref:Uncharacterized protein n=1 Tax=Elysia crispata TaxID=231223 RepID=A0AAE1AWT2_9GAST|nr:hypothetical protein RRG08_028340 [Elysia crispata]